MDNTDKETDDSHVLNMSAFVSRGSDRSHSKKRRMTDHSFIELKDQIVSNYSQLYLRDKFSDISIKVEDKTFPAHKAVLGSQSDFFDRLFTSPMKESTKSEVELKDTDPRVFRMLLKLTYCGQINFNEILPEDIIRVFSLVQRYQFIGFEEPYLLKLKSFIQTKHSNVWPMFNTAVECQSSQCLDVCISHLNSTDHSLLESDHFLKLSFESIKTLLLRDSFPSETITEIQLFLATEKWLKANDVNEQCKQELVKCIRLTLIRFEDLMNHVSKSYLLSEPELMDVLRCKALSDNWPKSGQHIHQDKQKIWKRAFVVQDTDLCQPDFKYQVYEGQVGDLCGRMDTNLPQIVIKLGFPMNINYVELKLSDIRGDRFSYKITYSVEGLEWKTLLDYTSYTTANFQKLHFEPIVVQELQISGTHQLRMDSNTRAPFNRIVSIICRFNSNQHMVERLNGLLSNPYWIRQSVQQRVYHDSNNGPNGHNNGNALNPINAAHSPVKYYSRKLASNKPIIVALDQPVVIDSFQFHLYDKDDRAYSYVAEIKDNNEWIKLADKSSDKCRSLQTIVFSKRPVSLVRVRATQIHNVQCTEFRITKFHFPRIGSMF